MTGQSVDQQTGNDHVASASNILGTEESAMPVFCYPNGEDDAHRSVD